MTRTPGKDASVELLPPSSWRTAARRRLLAWYRLNARSLPWRERSDAYGIWVSEIMLQQTQVATVVDYYERFLQAFPTLSSLAQADQRQVLRLWEGLGYYRRARQLHEAAQRVMQAHRGEFPQDMESARALPGIGRYTAGAILSIAYDLPHPILEANTIRLYSRLLAHRGDPTRSDSQRRLWAFAEAMLGRKQAGRTNQALMELGGEICVPRQPKCEQCPLNGLCPTYRHGWQDEIPAAAKKTDYVAVVEAAVVIWRSGRVLLRQCGANERWAGLWDFPRFSVSSSEAELVDRELKEKIAENTGLQIQFRSLLTTIKHGVTRYRITLHCREANCVSGRKRAGADLVWAPPRTLASYPLSVTGRKIARLLARGESTKYK